jgi:hypothetical protein
MNSNLPRRAVCRDADLAVALGAKTGPLDEYGQIERCARHQNMRSLLPQLPVDARERLRKPPEYETGQIRQELRIFRHRIDRDYVATRRPGGIEGARARTSSMIRSQAPILLFSRNRTAANSTIGAPNRSPMTWRTTCAASAPPPAVAALKALVPENPFVADRILGMNLNTMPVLRGRGNDR